MRLVDEDREALVRELLHGIDDVGELGDRRGDDLRPALQGRAEVIRGLVLVERGDFAVPVVEREDGLLELAVHHDAVGHDHDRAEPR